MVIARMFGSLGRRAGLANVYFILPALWLLLAIAVTASYAAMAYKSVQMRFMERSVAFQEHVFDVLQSNEAVLEGFAALLGVMDELDTDKAARYARQMIARYPHIYMLEVVERVPRKRLADFEQIQAAAGRAGFRVRSFGYQGDRAWRGLPVKPYYYPIVFMEPMPPQSEEVLGLDIDSVPFLRRAMEESKRRGTFVASHPFQLVEGDWAYVMHRPVDSGANLFALLVIKSQAILASPLLQHAPRMDIHLHHADFPASDPRGTVWHRDAAASGDSLSGLLPKLRYSQRMKSAGQPFVLVLEKQLHWSDFNIALLTGMTLINAVMFFMLFSYARSCTLRESARQVHVSRLAYMASHDALTGIPNRAAMMERLEALISRSERHGEPFALLFLDIDGFKQVNDTYGHDVGDQLLKTVAEAIRHSVRTQDMAVRLSGDEFVVLLEQVADRAQAEAIGAQIVSAIPTSLGEAYPDLRIGMSLGLAMYPEDGEDAATLLKQADAAMYAMKRQQAA